MAKTTMVLKVKIKSEKLRTKAMKIAAGTHGVTKVQLEKDQEDLLVEGEEVNVRVLVLALRKEVGDADISTFSTEK